MGLPLLSLYIQEFGVTDTAQIKFYTGGVLMLIGFAMVLLLLVEDKSTYGAVKPRIGIKKSEKDIFTSYIVSLLLHMFILVSSSF